MTKTVPRANPRRLSQCKVPLSSLSPELMSPSVIIKAPKASLAERTSAFDNASPHDTIRASMHNRTVVERFNYDLDTATKWMEKIELGTTTQFECGSRRVLRRNWNRQNVLQVITRKKFFFVRASLPGLIKLISRRSGLAGALFGMQTMLSVLRLLLICIKRNGELSLRPMNRSIVWRFTLLVFFVCAN